MNIPVFYCIFDIRLKFQQMIPVFYSIIYIRLGSQTMIPVLSVIFRGRLKPHVLACCIYCSECEYTLRAVDLFKREHAHVDRRGYALLVQVEFIVMDRLRGVCTDTEVCGDTTMFLDRVHHGRGIVRTAYATLEVDLFEPGHLLRGALDDLHHRVVRL